MLQDNSDAGSAGSKIDTTRPSVARCYDAVLGGKDNFEVDREVRAKLFAAAPELRKLAWDNREFLIRATRFLAGRAGISQFLDCGSGLPTIENTHEVAQWVNPEAHVVYVDNDPVVLAHGRALLEDNGYTHFADADYTKPDEMFEHPVLARNLDLKEPVALYHIATLHHLRDHKQPYETLSATVDALPTGSYVVVTHFYRPDADQGHNILVDRLEQAFDNSGMGPGVFRRLEEIERFFDGLDPVEPGLVRLADWWPDGPRLEELQPVQELALGAVARKR